MIPSCGLQLWMRDIFSRSDAHLTSLNGAPRRTKWTPFDQLYLTASADEEMLVNSRARGGADFQGYGGEYFPLPIELFVPSFNAAIAITKSQAGRSSSIRAQSQLGESAEHKRWFTSRNKPSRGRFCPLAYQSHRSPFCDVTSNTLHPSCAMLFLHRQEN